MNRRDSLKILGTGSVGLASLLAACDTGIPAKQTAQPSGSPEIYGRTEEEKQWDEKLMSETFFTPDEMAMLAILCDIIIPADDRSGSASDAGVPAFIEFTVKEQPGYQAPLRGGLRWLNLKCARSYGGAFAEASPEQRIALVEQIAYPYQVTPENSPGAAFFTMLRNLTATGFFTSKMGMDDLQYKGNTPNFWDGVPEDVLAQYGLSYDEKLLQQCLKAEDKGKMMVWED